MNVTLNYTTIPGLVGKCMDGRVVNTQCVVNEICHQTNAHYIGWSIGLLAAFVFIDIIFKPLSAWIASRLPQTAPNWVLWLMYAYNRDFVKRWLKDRLLWAFVILTLYRLVY